MHTTRTNAEKDLPFANSDPSDAATDAMIEKAMSFERPATTPPARTGISLPACREPSRDPFTQLPADVLHATMTLLPSRDVCNSRLASRALASVSHPSELPQTFYASRFAGDHEMAFFLAGRAWGEGESSRKMDWRSLYSNVRSSLQVICSLSKDGHDGMRNRRRIWSSVQFIAGPLRLKIGQHYARLGETFAPPPASALYQPGPCICTQRLFRNYSLDPQASEDVLRLLEAWDLVFPTCISPCSTRVIVSFITFNCMRYMSGLTAETSSKGGDSMDAVSYVSAGLIGTGDEEGFSLSEAEIIVSVVTYTRADGVAGLDFVIRNVETLETTRRLVGDTDTSVGGLGVSHLTSSSEDTKISGLKLGFDVSSSIPIVRLSLLTPSRSANASPFRFSKLRATSCVRAA